MRLDPSMARTLDLPIRSEDPAVLHGLKMRAQGRHLSKGPFWVPPTTCQPESSLFCIVPAWSAHARFAVRGHRPAMSLGR